MPKKESPLTALDSFLPEGSLQDVLHYLQQFKVHLTITKERKSILGDYRNKFAGRNHRITVNGNLNKYSFLITLLHELAHLFAYEKFRHTIQPHGFEWKKEFANILSQFINKKIFPADIKMVLLESLKNPAASSCADISLIRILRKYNNKKEGIILIEELPEGSLFKIPSGKVYKKGKKMRRRYRCEEISTGKIYLFSPVYEIAHAGS